MPATVDGGAAAPAPPAPYRTRLDVLFARDAAKAVILRRGPKTHYHLIAWDLATHRFDHGQWMKGYVRLCDLSPDGGKLLYWAHQYHASARWRRERDAVEAAGPYDPLGQQARRRSPKKRESRRKTPRYQREIGVDGRGPRRPIQGVWTAVSVPPFFSALAVWPSFGHWTGGGLFLSNREIVLGAPEEALTPKANAPLPSGLRITSIVEARARESWPPDLGATGWEGEADPVRAQGEVVAGLRAGGATWVEFAAPRPDGSLLFGCDGRVLRLERWRDHAPEARLAAAERLADFNDLVFERMAPAEDAMRW